MRSDKHRMILRKRVGDSIHFKVEFASTWTRTVGSTIAHHIGGFTDDDSSEPDFSITFGEKPDIPTHSSIIDGVYVTEDSIAETRRSYKGGKWSYCIRGLESGELACDISANAIGLRYMAGTVLYLCFLLASVRKKLPLIHASAVESHGKGIVISARGGAGKTTIAMRILEDESAKLVSDNYLFLDEGRVESYPAPLNLFSYNINDQVMRALSKRTRFELASKKALNTISFGKVKLFVAPTMNEVLGNLVASGTRTSSLILLLPTEGELSDSEVGVDYAANFLTWNQRSENSLYEKALTAHAYQYPNGSMGKLWQSYQIDVRGKLMRFDRMRLVKIPEGPIDRKTVDFVREVANA